MIRRLVILLYCLLGASATLVFSDGTRVIEEFIFTSENGGSHTFTCSYTDADSGESTLSWEDSDGNPVAASQETEGETISITLEVQQDTMEEPYKCKRMVALTEEEDLVLKIHQVIGSTDGEHKVAAFSSESTTALVLSVTTDKSDLTDADVTVSCSPQNTVTVAGGIATVTYPNEGSEASDHTSASCTFTFFTYYTVDVESVVTIIGEGTTSLFELIVKGNLKDDDAIKFMFKETASDSLSLEYGYYSLSALTTEQKANWKDGESTIVAAFSETTTEFVSLKTIKIDPASTVKSPYTCEIGGVTKSVSVYKVTGTTSDTQVVVIGKTPTKATHTVTTDFKTISVEDVTVSCKAGNSNSATTPTVTLDGTGGVSVTVTPPSSIGDTSFDCDFTFFGDIDSKTTVTTTLTMIQYEITHSPEILMTDLPITFTCTCKGTEVGCGTLKLTPDTISLNSGAWDDSTNSITGTGTVTFTTNELQKKFTCGSDTQSDSSVYAESTLDIVGVTLGGGLKENLAVGQDVSVVCKIGPFSVTPTGGPAENEVSIESTEGGVLRTYQDNYILYTAKIKSDAATAELPLAFKFNDGTAYEDRTVSTKTVNVIALTKGLDAVYILDEGLEECSVGKVSIAVLVKSNEPTITWNEESPITMDVNSVNAAAIYESREPGFKCKEELTGKVEYTGDSIISGFQLSTSTSVQRTMEFGTATRFLKDSDVDKKNYGFNLTTTTDLTVETSCNGEPVSNARRQEKSITSSEDFTGGKTCKIDISSNEVAKTTKQFSYTFALDVLVLESSGEIIVGEGVFSEELKCKLTGPNKDELDTAYKSDPWTADSIVQQTKSTTATETTFTVTATAPGVYTCQVESTDGTDEKVSVSATIYQVSSVDDITVYSHNTDTEKTLDCSKSYTVNPASNTLTPTYSWTRNNEDIVETTAAITIEPVDTDYYDCKMTFNTVSVSQKFTIAVTDPAIVVTPASVKVYQGTETEITIKVTGVDPASTVYVSITAANLKFEDQMLTHDVGDNAFLATTSISLEDDAILTFSIKDDTTVTQDVQFTVAKWISRPDKLIFNYKNKDDTDLVYSIEQIDTIVPNIVINSGSNAMTCNENSYNCSYTHEISAFEDNTITATITSTKDPDTYSVVWETKTVARSLTMMDSPFFLAQGSVAQLTCKLIAEERNTVLAWDLPTKYGPQTYMYNETELAWLGILDITKILAMSTPIRLDDLNSFKCLSATYDQLPAVSPDVKQIIKLPKIGLSIGTVDEDKEVFVTCTFTEVTSPGTFEGMLDHPGTGTWNAETSRSEVNGGSVIIKYTNVAIHYSDAGSYSCKGTYSHSDEIVVVESEMETLAVNAHAETNSYFEAGQDITMTVQFSEDIKMPVKWYDELSGKTYNATTVTKRTSNDIKAVFSGKTTTLTAPKGSAITSTRKFKISAKVEIDGNDVTKFERRTLDVYSVKTVNALIDSDSEIVKGKGIVEFEGLPNFNGLPAVNINGGLSVDFESNNHDNNVFVFVTPTDAITTKTSVDVVVKFGDGQSSTQSLTFGDATIETVPMRDVEMKRVIYDESDDRSENDDIALSCTFKSESTFTIIKSSVMGNGTSLEKGTAAKIDVKWSEINADSTMLTCFFEVEFMNNVASFSREFQVQEKKSSKNAGAIAAAVVIAILIIAIIVVFFVYRARKSRRPNNQGGGSVHMNVMAEDRA